MSEIADILARVANKVSADIRDIHGKLWDVGAASRIMPRYEFIAYFVARQTRTAKGRKLVGGYQVVKRSDGWEVLVPLGKRHVSPYPIYQNVQMLYDAIRRTPLEEYVRQAEDLRGF